LALREAWSGPWWEDGVFAYWHDRMEIDGLQSGRTSTFAAEVGVSGDHFGDRGFKLISFCEKLMTLGIRQIFVFSLGDSRWFGVPAAKGQPWWNRRRDYLAFLELVNAKKPQYDALFALEPNVRRELKHIAWRMQQLPAVAPIAPGL
jgi:hypothetical protein